MTRIIMLLCTMSAIVMVNAETFSYRFNSTPLPKAIQRIMESHHNLDINFIYNELENYKTSSIVNADNAYDALRQTIGLNPVTVVKAKNTYYVEALQHGKYIYTGKTIGTDNSPVAAATILLLSPKDSTVLTYAVADNEGRFSIPCDRRNVIAKISCIGYKTKLKRCKSFQIGTIVLEENAHQLNSVTVNANLQNEYSDRSVFLPTGRQKQNSNGAIDLLDQMAIPMIKIDPITEKVTTNSNKDVAIFINMSEATQQDLEALNPNDVKTVEYLVNPIDARYHHQPYVVNITLKKIEYGGYTKLRGTGNLIAGSANALAYTKFSFKRMTYDLSLSDYYLNSHHGGSEGQQTYTLANGRQVTRDTKLTDYHTQSNSFSVALRAKYEDKRKSISNRLTLSYNRQPHADSEGKITFSPNTSDGGDTYSSLINRRTIYPTWRGEYYFDFGNNLYLSLNPNIDYYHVNSDSRYRSFDTDIITIARENMVNGSIQAQINKRFNKKHGLSFSAIYAHIHDKVEYTGSTPSIQIFRDIATVGFLTYSLNTKKLYAQFTFGGAAEWNHIDGKNTHDILPAGYLSLQYAFDRSKSLEFSANYATNITDISTKGGNIVQSNELLYITGNPCLKNSRHFSSDFSFNWSPLKELSVSADLGYFEIFKRPVAVFIPYLDGKAVLRTIENDGTYSYEYAGLSFTSRLFDNSLILSFKPQVWFYQTTGEYEDRRAAFLYNISARYYFGKFYVSAYCNSGDDMLVQQSMWSNRTKTKLTYGASIGWGNGKWTLRATAYNPFRNSWKGDRSWLNGKYFSSEQTEISRNYHQWFNFTATYTFNYGKKKVRKGDEVSAGSNANSAIMK